MSSTANVMTWFWMLWFRAAQRNLLWGCSYLRIVSLTILNCVEELEKQLQVVFHLSENGGVYETSVHIPSNRYIIFHTKSQMKSGYASQTEHTVYPSAGWKQGRGVECSMERVASQLDQQIPLPCPVLFKLFCLFLIKRYVLLYSR